MKKNIALSLLICSVIAGCNPIEPIKDVAPDPLIRFLTGGFLGDNYSATFKVGHEKMNWSTGSITYKDAHVYVYDSTASSSINGGPVTFNGTGLVPTDYTSSGGGYYYTGNTKQGHTVPVTFDGTYHRFNVSGNTGFPGLTDSLVAPNIEMTVSNPTTSSTLLKSTGFTLVWTTASGTNSTIVVAISDTANVGFVFATNDDGSESISSGALSTLSPGPLTVSVTRATWDDNIDPYGRRYLMSIFSRHTVHATLN